MHHNKPNITYLLVIIKKILECDIFLLEWDSFPESSQLTHLPMDKMVAILADDIFNCIFLNENGRIPIHSSLKYVPLSPINNEPAFGEFCSCNGLALSRRQAITWTKDDPLHRRIYIVHLGGGGGGGWVKRGFKYHFTSQWTCVSADISRSVSGSLYYNTANYRRRGYFLFLFKNDVLETSDGTTIKCKLPEFFTTPPTQKCKSCHDAASTAS